VKNIAGAILFFFLCLFLYTKFLGPFPFSVNSIQTTKTDVFQVDGQGSATAVPNSANISFSVTKQATNVQDAQNQTNSTVQKVLDGLKQDGIDAKDIKTTNYSLSPNYTVNSTISGYSVTQSIQLHLEPLDKTNNAIDTITSNGGNNIGQVDFGFDDATQASLEDKARKDAVEKAKAKAESLARASGIRLGPIINVVESSNTIPRPVPLMMNAKAGAGESQPTQVTPGESTISTSVTLSYQIY